MFVTPKQRMLNAYRGLEVDKTPVAPEFWIYYPAKLLGLNMIEFEREIPFWQALKHTFEHFNCEGWGITGAGNIIADMKTSWKTTKVNENQYMDTATIMYRGTEFETITRRDKDEPAWRIKHMVSNIRDLPVALAMYFNEENGLDFSGAISAYNSVGESYLLEIGIGCPFFDFIAELLGFEKAAMYFNDEEESVLDSYLERYTEYQLNKIREIAKNTPFESFFIGCSYSCNSLIGKNMWRRWDKPYIKAAVDEIHKANRLVHIHFHGGSIETAADFAEIGIDCVCPFERPPGGDVAGLEGLKYVRSALADKVAFNGNVHTVETLIRGNPEDVRREVREIREAFAGSNRLIIGTGDQVGKETPDENIYAMLE